MASAPLACVDPLRGPSALDAVILVRAEAHRTSVEQLRNSELKSR